MGGGLARWQRWLFVSCCGLTMAVGGVVVVNGWKWRLKARWRRGESVRLECEARVRRGVLGQAIDKLCRSVTMRINKPLMPWFMNDHDATVIHE